MKKQFKEGDLVTIEAYGTITKILPFLGEAIVRFESRDTAVVPLDYLCPVPQPAEDELEPEYAMPDGSC